MDNNSEAVKLKPKSAVIQLLIAIFGTFVAVFGLSIFNQHLLMSFPLSLRMILMLVTQWMLFLVPGILMIVNKEKISDIGFRKEKLTGPYGEFFGCSNYKITGCKYTRKIVRGN